MSNAKPLDVLGPRPLTRFGPEAEGRQGTVLIVHGMSEHSARYRPLAEALRDAGWVSYYWDLPGHGPHIPTEDLGWFGERGWDRVVDEVAQVVAEVRNAERGPLVLLGHSMGSLISRAYLSRYRGRHIQAAALSGTSGPPPFIARVGRWVAYLERMRLGARGRSSLLDKLAFGAFNQSFRPNRTEFDWLSREHHEVDLYVEDPLCGFLCSNQLWVDLLEGLPELTRIHELQKIPSDMPIYLFAGSRDPVGDAGKGVTALGALYKQAGLSSVTLRIYSEARHEVLNETNRSEVYGDLVSWLNDLPSEVEA